MSISNQELADLKSRALTATRTRANIARVGVYLDELIREVGFSQPERGKETDTEYLLTVIAEVEAQRAKPQKKTSTPRHEKVETKEPKPVVVEAPPEVTAEETSQDDQWSEPVRSFLEEQEESSEVSAPEDAHKSKSGKKSKAEKKTK